MLTESRKSNLAENVWRSGGQSLPEADDILRFIETALVISVNISLR